MLALLRAAASRRRVDIFVLVKRYCTGNVVAQCLLIRQLIWCVQRAILDEEEGLLTCLSISTRSSTTSVPRCIRIGGPTEIGDPRPRRYTTFSGRFYRSPSANICKKY